MLKFSHTKQKTGWTMGSTFLGEVKSFASQHKVLCVATAGLAVAVYAIGRLGARAVVCLRHCLQGTAKTTDEVGRERILDAQKYFGQDNGEISLDLLRTAPQPFNPNKDYFAFRCSTRLDTNFAGDQFGIWRRDKEDPVILAVTPGVSERAIMCPAIHEVGGEDVPVVQLFFLNDSLSDPGVLEENRRKIQSLGA
ncbi:MAG: hypothetical protein HYZ48_02795 [Chlamydiales bacterium]|nr:hypothetical protein [Chlamydiales bacterium]